MTLPALAAVERSGTTPLSVVATTSIIGDVVAQVGGDLIALTTLMGPGQDPHSYEPGAQTLTAVAEADVLFVNGWELEEGLLDDLRNVGADVPMVPISANIVPITPATSDEDAAHHDEDENQQQSLEVDSSVHK